MSDLQFLNNKQFINPWYMYIIARGEDQKTGLEIYVTTMEMCSLREFAIAQML